MDHWRFFVAAVASITSNPRSSNLAYVLFCCLAYFVSASVLRVACGGAGSKNLGAWKQIAFRGHLRGRFLRRCPGELSMGGRWGAPRSSGFPVNRQAWVEEGEGSSLRIRFFLNHIQWRQGMGICFRLGSSRRNMMFPHLSGEAC